MQRGIREGRAAQLQGDLLLVIAVDMAVAAGPESAGATGGWHKPPGTCNGNNASGYFYLLRFAITQNSKLYCSV